MSFNRKTKLKIEKIKTHKTILVAAVLSIADGHAEIRKGLDAAAKKPGAGGVRLAPRDVPWIQERASKSKRRSK